MRRQNGAAHGGLVTIIAIMLVIFLSSELASGQFLVQPMLLELTLRRGKRAVTELRLENVGTVSAHIIDLSVIELAQVDDAKWAAILPDPNLDTSMLSSCSRWLSFGSSSVEVPPVTIVPVTLTIAVPPDARGFYCAAVMAQMRLPDDIKGIGVDVRFLIPVLVQIEGRPMRHRVELTDVGMEVGQPTAQNPATTLVSLKIANNGGTYSRLNGYARVDGVFAGHSRQITTAEFKEVGIIPGVEYTLRHDINRPLPSGKYKVIGTLFVDGRRIKPLMKEIDFVGDPSVNVASVDTALLMEPGEVVMDSIPGATRTKTVAIHNTSTDEAVNVRVVPTIPPHLAGASHGTEFRGPELSCAAWVKVQPEKFTLRAGARQRIVITTKMPNPGKMHAYYYALLNLMATYPDGQNAGVTKGYVIVVNKQVETRYDAVATREPSLGAMEGSKYVVVSGFGNIGNVHFRPRCKATVTTLDESATMANVLLSGKLHSMLPLEMRSFSGVLDFSEIPAGTYRLTVIFEYAPGEAESRYKPIQVSVQGDQRVVRIMSEEELKKIGIAW